MGRKRSEQEIQVIQDFFQVVKNEYALFDLELNSFISRKDELWQQFSKELINNAVFISPGALCTAVTKDYYNLWRILNISKDNCTSKETSLSCSFMSSNVSVDSLSNDQSPIEQSMEFQCMLQYQEFKDLKAEIVTYQRNDKFGRKMNRKSCYREYNIFEKYNRTNIIRMNIYKTTTLECFFFVFKRCKISTCGPIYANIFGKCKECEAVLIRKIMNPPLEDEDIILHFSLSGQFNMKHVQQFKMALQGRQRIITVQRMANEYKSATKIRNIMANELCQIKTTKELSFIPKLSTLRCAKSLHEKKSRLDEDPIVALYQAKTLQKYGGAIKNIGYCPFYIHIWSNTQIMIYRNYCKTTSSSRISVDSTGGVVKRIIYPNKLRSQYIFLYDIVVNSESGQYSVGSMLSDTQSSIAIKLWFQAAGSIHPCDVVTDMSLALMYACASVFTEFKTLEDYIERCYGIVTYRKTTLPKTYQSMFIVALSDTEGVNEEGIETTCENKKQRLIKRSATGTVELTNISEILPDNSQEHFLSKNLTSKKAISNSFKHWVQNILEDVKSIVNKSGEIGNRGNQQVLPLFIDDFLKLACYIPMWTAIMSPFFCAKRIASSTPVEGNFNNLKNRLFSDKMLPLRVDDFVFEYVKCIYGSEQLEPSTVTNKLSDSDRQNIENIVQKQVDKKLSYAKKILLDNSYSDMSDDKMDSITTEIKDRSNATLFKGRVDNLNRLDINNEFRMTDNVCSSCQLGIEPLASPSNKFCSTCGIAVHNNDNCVVLYQDHQLCKTCFKTGLTNKRHIDNAVEENWMNKNVPPKKRPRKSYLEPDSELLQIDFSKQPRSTAIGLLRNGNVVHTAPIKVSGYKITLKNTCAIDSLVQLMCVGFCDSQQFEEAILELINNSNNLLCLLIEKVIKKGVTAAYPLRAKILYQYFPKTKVSEEIWNISVETEIFNCISKIFGTLCLVSEVLNCTTCKKIKSKDIHYISLEINRIEHLNLIVDEYISSGKLCKDCKHYVTVERHFTTHLLIEPVNFDALSLEIKTCLDNIPKYICIGTTKFILRGVIGYQGLRDQSNLGHFIAYAYRHNDKWVCYNDLLKKTESCFLLPLCVVFYFFTRYDIIF